MTTEAIIAIVALSLVLVGIIYMIRIGRKEAEMIFESDYYHLADFIKHCHLTEENELKIKLQLIHLSKMPGADKEKLQVLNSEFRRKFTASLSDIVADHENY
ncbi:MAG: hypothetical protein ABFC18_03360 [Rikenellaceae bacterium]